MTGHPGVPDGEFWVRYLPVPDPGDDTIYWNSTEGGPELHVAAGQDDDQAGRAWFWVVWWRGRLALSGWAQGEAAAAQAAAATTADPLTRHLGAAARYLAAPVPPDRAVGPE